jgi:secondary thiamine-phosphate synthase enzyme
MDRRRADRARWRAMKVHQDTVTVRTSGPGLVDVTKKIAAVVQASGVDVGTCSVFVQHTSASLVVQENADPAVLRDLAAWMARIAPEDPEAYEHDDEGPDDMPGHLRSSVTKTSETLPITAGELALGTWQALYLWEHRHAPHTRRLVVTIMGTGRG